MIKYLDLKKVTAIHGDEIQQAVSHVVDSGWYLHGEATSAFERHYAQYIGSNYCIGCGNGLDALTLILRAYKEMGIMNEGDEVIVPANTFIATILAITENGLVPVLIEPRRSTLQIDDELVERDITPRTRGLMLVHLYGRCAYTEKIGELCRNHDLKLIEDNAQAHGCVFRAADASHPKNMHHTGSLGDAAAHSFYPGKNLGALGDAGAVTTNDSELAAMIRKLGNYGSAEKYVFTNIGRNSRLDELQAAVLDVKLKYLDTDNERRCSVANRLISGVHNDDISMPSANYFDNSVFHIFPIFSIHRDSLQQYLLDNGVQTMIHYPIPPHLQHCYAEAVAAGRMRLPKDGLPITESIHSEELSLPCNQVMTDDEVTELITLLNAFSHT